METNRIINILIIIPARGGSKGIPQKNLRTLSGKPLLYYSIKTALNSRFKPDVYVSSDDEEIRMIARKFGAKIHCRNSELADDRTTLDPVIYNAYKEIVQENSKRYDLIVTMQPTSPLLKAASLDNAIEEFLKDEHTDTMISAREETHLSWRLENNGYVPNYKERVNRQYLPPTFPETGSFVICKASLLEESKKRIGKKINLYLLPTNEAIDIDTYEDWNLCEYLLKRKTVLFVLSGYSEIGLGHIYRGLVLANSILNHHLIFLMDNKSHLGYEKIKEQHYEVYMQESKDIVDDIKKLNSDIIINDILDTDAAYIKKLKALGLKVINFEDIGSGAKEADLVINALYPEREPLPNHHYGYLYFCPRDEFLFSGFKRVTPEVKHVLITMGGIDSNNLTYKALDAIYQSCQEKNIAISVILGMGYKQEQTVSRFSNIQVYRDIKTMSDFMLRADIIFTSAGRTVYEAACVGTPTIVLSQNEREMTHFFAQEKYGFLNLGLGIKVSGERIRQAFIGLVNDFSKRLEAHQLMLAGNVRDGKIRVINLIQNVIRE